jgi:hypothetical protein
MARKIERASVPPCPQHTFPGRTRQVQDPASGQFFFEYEPMYLAEEQAKCDAINETREKERTKKQKQRAAVAAVTAIACEDDPLLNYDNPEEPNKDEARELLKKAGIEHPGAITMLLRNTPLACEAVGVPHNRHSYRFGVLSQYIKKCKILKEEAMNVFLLPNDQFDQQDEPLFLKPELDFFYGNYSAFIGAYAGKPQAEWLRDRQMRYDGFRLLKNVLSVPCDELQEEMCNFICGDKSAARFLPRLYDHRDVQNVLRAYGGPEGEDLKKMAMLFRAAGKTTVGTCNVLQNILLIPDFRAILGVESKESAQDILTLMRSYFEVSDFAAPNKLASLWPEHMIPEKKTDRKNFKSPLRRLKLKEPTIAITSPESSSSSKHSDLLYLDDWLGNDVGSSEDPKRHALLLKKYDLLLSLLDGWGTELILCTPYQPGDMYSEVIKRDEARNGKLRLLRKPVWTVLPEFAEIEKRFPASLPELQAHMVKMADLSGRITFDQMKGLAIDNWTDFQRQRLVIPSFSEDHNAKIFSMDDLQACVIHESQVPTQANFHTEAIVDPSHFGSSIQADETAIALVSKYRNPATGVEELYVRSLDAFKDQPDVASVKIASQMPLAQHKNCRLVRIAVEKGPANQLFEEKIIEAARLRSFGDIRRILSFFDKDKTKGAKANRIKNVQLLVKAKEIFFVAGDWNDGLFAQFLAFNGETTGAGVKDDRADVISLAVMLMRGATIAPKKPEAPKDNQPRDHWGRTKEEADEAWRAGESARNAAAVRDMMASRTQIESQQQQELRKAKEAAAIPQWSKAPGGGFFKTPAPIDASGQRDATGRPVSRYGVPQRGQ